MCEIIPVYQTVSAYILVYIPREISGILTFWYMLIKIFLNF